MSGLVAWLLKPVSALGKHAVPGELGPNIPAAQLGPKLRMPSLKTLRLFSGISRSLDQ
jgi:hypothetical protein